MASHHPAHSKPRVIQGNFLGGQPAFVVQARPSFPTVARRQTAPHVAAALQKNTEGSQAAQPKTGPQPPATQPDRIGHAFQVPPTVNLARTGRGQPLPDAVRRKMESFFNADFSDVRVHVGPQAQSIGAVAFTMGSQIHFAPGQYNPSTSHGQRLLGHELTHVMQQRAGRVRNPFGSGVAVVQEPGLEAEAERMGIRVAMTPMPVQAKLAYSNAYRSPGVLQAKLNLYGQGGGRKAIKEYLTGDLTVDDDLDSGCVFKFSKDNWNGCCNWISDTVRIKIGSVTARKSDIGLHLNLSFDYLQWDNKTNFVKVKINNFHLTIRAIGLQEEMDKISGSTSSASLSLHKGLSLSSGTIGEVTAWHAGSKKTSVEKEAVKKMGALTQKEITTRLKNLSPKRLLGTFKTALAAKVTAKGHTLKELKYKDEVV